MPAPTWASVEEQTIPELEWLLQVSVLFALARCILVQEDSSDPVRIF